MTLQLINCDSLEAIRRDLKALKRDMDAFDKKIGDSLDPLKRFNQSRLNRTIESIDSIEKGETPPGHFKEYHALGKQKDRQINIDQKIDGLKDRF
jgi:hypothetical protein